MKTAKTAETPTSMTIQMTSVLKDRIEEYATTNNVASSRVMRAAILSWLGLTEADVMDPQAELKPVARK